MNSVAEFRRRAIFEARRYGGDAWIFVRELLQNSRDAGANRVEFVIERSGGVDRIVCRDDGCGMTFDHARHFLFTLYASSKSGETDTAGRFGIGFWSVLRFNPDRVTVRSSPADGPAWELRMTGDLEEIERGTSSIPRGTEIVLVRPTRGDDPLAAVWASVRRDARHLRRRGKDDEILDVRVNGRRATEEMGLDAPSLGFVRRGFRGAVALSDRPRVDLLAHGLRVRSTATLDELLTQPDRPRRSSAIPDQLVPRVILDSRRLQVLMARGDARTDRELRRLVALGQRGVRRLIRGQLDREAGLGPVGSGVMRAFEVAVSRRARWIVGMLVVVAAVVTGAWLLSRAGESPQLEPATASVAAASLAPDWSSAILESDLVDRYRGPTVDPLGPSTAVPDLRYLPEEARPMFAILRVNDLDDEGRVVAGDIDLQPYRGGSCQEHCLEVALELDGDSRLVKLPVPTGHLLDPESLKVVGGAARLWAGTGGLPLLELAGGGRHRVEYRTGPAVEMTDAGAGRWPALPEDVEDFAVRLRPLRSGEAALAARDWIGRRVVYDTSHETMEHYREAERNGLSFAERCLVVGAGDCDVQNTLLAAVLARSGISVRLAVGFVGAGGHVLPGLHAWVEYRGEDGRWRWVDASQGGTARSEVESHSRRGPVSGPGVRNEIPDGPAPGPRSPAVLSRFRPVSIGLFIVVALGSAVVLARRTLSVRDVQLDDAPNIAGLIRGALARPESYREVPALFRRRVVPMIGAPSLNLDHARTLASRGQLAVSAGSSSFALRAVDQGRFVVDGSQPEGEAAAVVLGATDLDRWNGMIVSGESHPVMRRLEDEAATFGLTWNLILCPNASSEIDLLQASDAGWGKRHLTAAVCPSSELWQRVVELDVRWPATAILYLADHVAEHGLTICDRSQRLLGFLAANALEEHAESIE